MLFRLRTPTFYYQRRTTTQKLCRSPTRRGAPKVVFMSAVTLLFRLHFSARAPRLLSGSIHMRPTTDGGFERKWTRTDNITNDQNSRVFLASGGSEGQHPFHTRSAAPPAGLDVDSNLCVSTEPHAVPPVVRPCFRCCCCWSPRSCFALPLFVLLTPPAFCAVRNKSTNKGRQKKEKRRHPHERLGRHQVYETKGGRCKGLAGDFVVDVFRPSQRGATSRQRAFGHLHASPCL